MRKLASLSYGFLPVKYILYHKWQAYDNWKKTFFLEFGVLNRKRPSQDIDSPSYFSKIFFFFVCDKEWNRTISPVRMRVIVSMDGFRISFYSLIHFEFLQQNTMTGYLRQQTFISHHSREWEAKIWSCEKLVCWFIVRCLLKAQKRVFYLHEGTKSIS